VTPQDKARDFHVFEPRDRHLGIVDSRRPQPNQLALEHRAVHGIRVWQRDRKEPGN
jgi:hypothetical protein